MFAASKTAAPATAANYIEDVFSTYLYTGNGSATYNNQLIQNGLNLNADENLGRDFLIWTKARSSAENNRLYSPVAYKGLISNSTAAAVTPTGWINSATNGYYLSTNASSFNLNTSNVTYASWTFRKQPKFFDVVTFTATSSNNQRVSHSLGSVPGCIIVKSLTYADQWLVYHTSQGISKLGYLNLTNAFGSVTNVWGTSSPTSTDFGIDAGSVLASGYTYVAYLFAHDAGGFGLTGTDNVISCGSYTGTGAAGNNITLGYEPQWLLIKQASAGTAWRLMDVMRGMSVGTADAILMPNASDAELDQSYGINWACPTATGFTLEDGNANVNNSGSTYIYIAIRRGPMKTPTSGTQVYGADAFGSPATRTLTTGFPVDLVLQGTRTTTNANNTVAIDRLRNAYSITTSTSAEGANTGVWSFASNTSFVDGFGGGVYWYFRRAPGFFDEVCYTGNATARSITHNLGVAPEMIIVKRRSAIAPWTVYHKNFTANGDWAELNNADAAYIGYTSLMWGTPYNGSPNMTATTFSLGSDAYVNANTSTYVAYLFATCPGVSKVGSYTGTGTTKQIDCGFTGGARFVLIKRTDSTGDWYVWDSARGIVAGNDPYLLLNSTAAEVTSTDYVDTYSAGFEISSTAPAAINANGGTFIFLAIA